MSEINNTEIKTKYIDEKILVFSYSILVNTETCLLKDICYIIDNYIPKCIICDESKNIMFSLFLENVDNIVCSYCIRHSKQYICYSILSPKIKKIEYELSDTSYCLICEEKHLSLNIDIHIQSKSHNNKLTKITKNTKEYYSKNKKFYKQIIDGKNTICGCGQLLDSTFIEHKTNEKHIRLMKIYKLLGDYNSYMWFIDLINMIEQLTKEEVYIELKTNNFDIIIFNNYTQEHKTIFLYNLENQLNNKNHILLSNILTEK